MYYEKKHFDFSQYGGFFAFSQKSFDEKKQPDTKYISADYWLFLPVDKAEEAMEAFSSHEKKEREEKIKQMWKTKIIEYELENYECLYTKNIEPAMNALDVYDITEEEIQAIYEQKLNEM